MYYRITKVMEVNTLQCHNILLANFIIFLLASCHITFDAKCREYKFQLPTSASIYFDVNCWCNGGGGGRCINGLSDYASSP